MTKNGEIVDRHKGVQTIDAATGETHTILMPIATLERLGYSIEDGVPVRVVVDTVVAPGWLAGR